MAIIPIHKKIGETPLECLERVRIEENIDSFVPMTYAGRLDPMAEGLLLILSGENVHRKDEFLSLPKQYELTILFGISTDTGDLLGIPENISTHNHQITRINYTDFIGDFDQEYPTYSSKTVAGKPLWKWAREEKLHQIKIPSKKINISNIDVLGSSTISTDDLLKKIHYISSRVRGDFRQQEIENSWAQYLSSFEPDSLFELRQIIVSCSSGTYMRALAQRIGDSVQLPALAYHIYRISIGDYTDPTPNK